MAFGDLLGTLHVNAASITNPTDAVGSVVVSLNDLIVVIVAEQVSLTCTGVTDNLGNAYTPVTAGTDNSNITGRAFYSVVTAAGTLTTCHVAATASADNVAIVAGAYAGLFAALPLDAAPVENTDNASPFTCPATGVLAQTNELVIAWGAATGTGSAVWSATSPNLLDINELSVTVIGAHLGHQVVSSTVSVAPEFTAGTNPTLAVLGVASFKQAVNALGGTLFGSSKVVFV